MTELAGQMAWFVQRITEDEANEEWGDGLETDSSPGDESAAPDACAPDIDSSSGESYPVPSGTPLDEIQRFYGATETVGEDIDTQLADIVDSLMTTRLPEDKLKEKHKQNETLNKNRLIPQHIICKVNNYRRHSCQKKFFFHLFSWLIQSC